MHKWIWGSVPIKHDSQKYTVGWLACSLPIPSLSQPESMSFGICSVWCLKWHKGDFSRVKPTLLNLSTPLNPAYTFLCIFWLNPPWCPIGTSNSTYSELSSSSPHLLGLLLLLYSPVSNWNYHLELLRLKPAKSSLLHLLSLVNWPPWSIKSTCKIILNPPSVQKYLLHSRNNARNCEYNNEQMQFLPTQSLR